MMRRNLERSSMRAGPKIIEHGSDDADAAPRGAVAATSDTPVGDVLTMKISTVTSLLMYVLVDVTFSALPFARLCSCSEQLMNGYVSQEHSR